MALWHLDGLSYCGDCVRRAAFEKEFTFEAFLVAANKLQHLGARLVSQAIKSVVRKREFGDKLTDRLAELSASGVLTRSIHEGFTTSVEGLIGLDLVSVLDKEEYGVGFWLPDMMIDGLINATMTHPEQSLGELFASPETRGDIEDSIFPLMGLLDTEAFLRAHRRDLDKINGAAFCLGLARMIELASTLRDGTPPPEAFGEEERKLYLELETERSRRAARAWHGMKIIAEGELKAQGDRAEELTKLWLLHPTPEPISRYLTLVYDSYVAGHFPQVVILCRAVVERAVRKALDEALPGVQPELMREKIRLLQSAKRLGRDGAKRISQVWLRGNKTIHETPNAVASTNVLATIEDTIRVVQELRPKPDAK